MPPMFDFNFFVGLWDQVCLLFSRTSLRKYCHSWYYDHENASSDGTLFEDAKAEEVNTKSVKRDRWYYPPDISKDLQGIDIAESVKEEVFACAWEYTRCVIPQYTNWPRYIAFMRIIVMGIIAEFYGTVVNVAADDSILGYNLGTTLDALFLGTPGHKAMCREYRAFLLITAEKASSRRNGELFRRYVNALAQSPKQWFRMRDGDALARFTIASALACNDLDDMWFSDEQFEILTEMGDTLYDAVAFYKDPWHHGKNPESHNPAGERLLTWLKHRSEGETNNTFAYMSPDIRVQAFHHSRELLWALDVAWATKPKLQCVINFVRFFGGPIHMMMRRYRFVEEGLTIGKLETAEVINHARRNVKLWNRVGHEGNRVDDLQRYKVILGRSETLMYHGLAEFLEKDEDDFCRECCFRESYGAENRHQFGGVALCKTCRLKFHEYSKRLPERAVKAFPELASVINRDIYHGQVHKTE